MMVIITALRFLPLSFCYCLIDCFLVFIDCLFGLRLYCSIELKLLVCSLLLQLKCNILFPICQFFTSTQASLCQFSYWLRSILQLDGVREYGLFLYFFFFFFYIQLSSNFLVAVPISGFNLRKAQRMDHLRCSS